MAKLPAVVGLIKWQLYWRDPQTGKDLATVQTFWTWKNDDPILDARFDAERDAIVGFATSLATRTITSANTLPTWVRGWDFSTTPPTKRMNHRIWPQVAMGSSVYAPPQTTAVIALRTQPVGSAVRNRLNGRTHHPYPARSFDQAGNWLSSERVALIAPYSGNLNVQLKTAANAARGNWVVPCFFEGGVLRVGGPLLPTVDHCVLRPQPGVVKSRLAHPGPYARGA